MRYSKLIAAAVACVVLGTIIYFLTNGILNGAGQATPDSSSSSNPVEEASAPTTQEPEQKPEEADDEPKVIGKTGEKLHEILLAAVEYYRDVAGNSSVITRDGFLYDAAADITITPEYLVTREYLPRSYLVDGAAILFVAPEDAVSIAPSFIDDSKELKVFAAAAYEGGYLLDTLGERQTTISNDDFGKLLSGYRTDHGVITRITGSTSDYSEINAAIKAFRNVNSDFYIRYGMKNDKYAVVIVSPKDNYNAISQYVLIYEDNKWNIRIPNLETVERTKVVINNVCHDLDPALVPSYDVSYYLGRMETDFAGVNGALIQDGYISENDAIIKYISATDKYLFAKYLNGQMFVGINTDDIWVLGEVLTPEDALARFKGIDERAPDFVIIWE